jgi:glutathione peroxidase
LEKLYKKYGKMGFTVLAFPCDQFKQEPGTNAEIKEFAQKKYKATFPLMSKIEAVNGPNAHPVWKFLKESKPAVVQEGVKERDALSHGAEDITWNFNKFLVNRAGKPIKRYPPKMDKAVYDQIEKDLQGMLDV